MREEADGDYNYDYMCAPGSGPEFKFRTIDVHVCIFEDDFFRFYTTNRIFNKTLF